MGKQIDLSGADWSSAGNGNGRASDRTLLAKMGFADPDRQTPEHEMACQYLQRPDIAERLVRHLWQGASPLWWVSPVEVTPEVQITKGAGKYLTTIGFADLEYTYSITTNLDVMYGRHASWLKQIEERMKQIEPDYRKHPGIYYIWEDMKTAIQRATILPFVRKGERLEMVGDFCWSSNDPIERLNEWLDEEQAEWEEEPREEWEEEWEPEEAYRSRVLSCFPVNHPNNYPVPEPGQPDEPGVTYAEHDRAIIIEVKTGRHPISDTIRQILMYRQHYNDTSSDLFYHPPTPTTYVLATTYPITAGDKKSLDGQCIEHIHLAEQYQSWKKAQERQPEMSDSPKF